MSSHKKTDYYLRSGATMWKEGPWEFSRTCRTCHRLVTVETDCVFFNNGSAADGGVVTRLLLFCANGGAAGPCVSSESAVGTGGSGAAAAEFGAVGQHRGEAVGPRRGV